MQYRWIASSGSTYRHAPWGHRPRTVSLRLEGLRVQILLTGYSQAPALLLSIRAGGRAQKLRRLLQQRALSRIAQQRNASRCLLREAVRRVKRKVEDQTKNDGTKEEGVPGPEGGLVRNQNCLLAKSRSCPECFADVQTTREFSYPNRRLSIRQLPYDTRSFDSSGNSSVMSGALSVAQEIEILAENPRIAPSGQLVAQRKNSEAV
jgi:hypothetical protein